MARHLRVEYAGAIYHVTIRGNGRQAIFEDDRDRERFVKRLFESVETYGVRLYLYCLMTNHVHLVIETPDQGLSRFMQSLETGYTVYSNLRHKKSGHVFQGRYGAKLVEGDEYLLKLSRYVHLNPVFVGRRKSLPLQARIAGLRDYRWSSYRGYIGQEKKRKQVTYGPVLAQTGVGKSGRPKAYGRFVEAGLAETDGDFLEILKGSVLAIGGAEFCGWVRDRWQELAEKAAQPEDVAFRRGRPRLGVEDVVAVVIRHLGVPEGKLREKGRNSIIRPLAAHMLAKYGGLTHRAIAGVLGMKSGVAASVNGRRATAVAASDRKVARLMDAIAADLRQMSEAKPA